MRKEELAELEGELIATSRRLWMESLHLQADAELLHDHARRLHAEALELRLNLEDARERRKATPDATTNGRGTRPPRRTRRAFARRVHTHV